MTLNLLGLVSEFDSNDKTHIAFSMRWYIDPPQLNEFVTLGQACRLENILFLDAEKVVAALKARIDEDHITGNLKAAYIQTLKKVEDYLERKKVVANAA